VGASWVALAGWAALLGRYPCRRDVVAAKVAIVGPVGVGSHLPVDF